MPSYVVISDQTYEGTISDLPYPTRLAWVRVLFEAEKGRGKCKLPARALAKKASITTQEAVEALEAFQRPDPLSSSKEHDGRRLMAIDGEEDWYLVVTWEKHKAERERFFNNLRQQRARDRKAEAEKRAQTALDSTNDHEEDATHGSNGDRGATGRGNGSASKMSDKQYAFHEVRIGKWLDEQRASGVDLTGADYRRKFKRDMGFTWQSWEAERDYRTNSNGA